MDNLTHAERGERGGRRRAEVLPADERANIARSGAAAVNSAAGLARRLARRWPELGRTERDEVRAILREGGVTT
jgi:hypothetical protein